MNFPEVSCMATRTGKCPVCGKRRKRSRKFWQTVNPWNRNEDGSIRTDREVWEAVKGQAAAWEADFTCTTDCSAVAQ